MSETWKYPRTVAEHVEAMLGTFDCGDGRSDLSLRAIGGVTAGLLNSKPTAIVMNLRSWVAEVLESELTRAEMRARAKALNEAAQLAERVVGNLQFVQELKKKAKEADDADFCEVKCDDSCTEEQKAEIRASLGERERLVVIPRAAKQR